MLNLINAGVFKNFRVEKDLKFLTLEIKKL